MTTAEMQVEESMIHFPPPPSSRYANVDSPSSTAFGSPAISDCGAGDMSVDPAMPHGCFVPSDLDSVVDFSTADGYDTQLYTMQQPSPGYPIAEIDLKELEDIIGPAVPPPVMEVDQPMAVAAAGSPGRPLDAGLHETERQMRLRAVHGAQQRPTELERSNSMSLTQQQQLPRLAHRLSLRVVSSPSPTMRPSARTGRPITNGGGGGGGGQRSQIRASKPIFPTESVPLQQVSRRERPPSATPSVFSSRSDPFDTRSTCASIGAASDPGCAYSVRSRDSGTGSVCSAPGILDGSSPGEYLDSPGDPLSESGTKACMEVEMNIKEVKKIIDLDRKILKLQAERSKLVEKASQNTAKAAESPNDKYSGEMTKPHELVRVHLFFVPVGIHMLDEPVFEEATTLLRRIGGKYVDLERAIATLRHICCKGMAVVPEFGTCFAYIKSLLQETQRLQLTESRGIYQIELDNGGAGSQPQPVPQEFHDALGMANRVLHAAQAITHSYHTIQMQLQKVQGMARDRSETCDALCQQIGLTDRDRRCQIQSVLDGNFAMLSTAVRVWPQYYRAASETIRAITQCIHPSA